MIRFCNLTPLIAFAALLVVLLAGTAQVSLEAADTAGTSITGITVLFKLDARMSGPTYGGERWVSPPTFAFAQAGKQVTVQATARCLDAGGQPVGTAPEWIPTDPEMVTVSPGPGNDVQITVLRAGESKLKVTSAGFTKMLSVKATYQGNAMQLEISQ